MSRLKADLAIGLAGLIWGFGFVAQKAALGHIGPFTFVAARFLISALVILPLALRERRSSKLNSPTKSKNFLRKAMPLGIILALGVNIQQYGMTATTVTNTAFINGLYIVLTPFAAYFLYRQKFSPIIFAASLLALVGIWLLSGGNLQSPSLHFAKGDSLILLGSICAAFQVAMLGHLASLLRAPFFLCLIEYLVTGLTGLLLAIFFEHTNGGALLHASIPILYSGLLSGCVAYSLQAIAQQHTPSADSAIILSGEALFGGLGGVLIMHDRLTSSGAFGCAAIMMAILVVEIIPLWKWNKNRRLKKASVN